MAKEKIRRKLLQKQPKRTKPLPRGNLQVTGNLEPGLHGVEGPGEQRELEFQGIGSDGQVTTLLPVTYRTKPPYKYNVRKGFEEAALPLEGLPGSEWWNDPKYKGRRR